MEKNSRNKVLLWVIIGVAGAFVLGIILLAFLVIGIFISLYTANEYEMPIIETDDKPVIYLYPEETADISVRLDYDGELTCTYPEYNDGWKVTAQPDGTLTDPQTGLTYSYLFWEGISNAEYDMSEGYVVAGEDTAEFLQEKLAEIGLTPREYNEFIVYWLPKMQENPYNLITFQQEAYTDSAKLNIDPQPDSVLRVFMAYKALEEPVEVKEPQIEPFEREGFCVVEWGGTCVY